MLETGSVKQSFERTNRLSDISIVIHTFSSAKASMRAAFRLVYQLTKESINQESTKTFTSLAEK